MNWWYEKNEAEKAVERLSGVRGVVNLIEIKPTISSNVVKDEIEKAFKRNASLVSKNVKVEIQGNKVILNGKLPDWHAIHEAETAAWAAPGVQEVVNNIRIEIPEYIETY